MEVEAILRLAESAKGLRQLHESQWRDIAQTMVPAASDIGTMRHPGGRRTDRVYDPTGMHGVMRLAAFLQSMMINFSARWFSLKMRLLADHQEANAWLEEVAQEMTASFNNNTSPLSQAVFEMKVQYVAFGTGAIFVDEAPMTFLDEPASGFRGYFAKSLPIGTYDICESPMGTSDSVFREFSATPHQLAQQFGREHLAPRMQEAFEARNEQQLHVPHEMLHAVFPRLARDQHSTDAKQKPWASLYIDRQHKHVVRESGFSFFPFMTPRWSKIIPFTPWGYGPGHLALPDVLSLNLIDKDRLRALPMSIFPPGWLTGASQELVGKVSLAPGTINPMAAGGGFVPYNSGIQLDKSIFEVQERQQRVRAQFFLDLFESLPPVEQAGRMTATEVLQRQRIMAQVMGPALRRWLSEFLNPFIDVTFAIGLDAGLFPDPPQVVLDVARLAGGQIDVEYEGVLSRAHQLESVDAIDDALLTGAQLAQQLQDPLLMRNLDVDQAYQDRMRAAGVPAHLIRDLEDVLAERAQAVEEQRAQLDAQNVRDDAGALGAAAPALSAINQRSGAV